MRTPIFRSLFYVILSIKVMQILCVYYFWLAICVKELNIKTCMICLFRLRKRDVDARSIDCWRDIKSADQNNIIRIEVCT